MNISLKPIKCTGLRHFALLLSLVSCVSLKNSKVGSEMERSNCNQTNAYTYTKEQLPVAIHELPGDTLLNSYFSFNSINIAHATGILEPLSIYVEKKKRILGNPSIEERLDLLELSQKIHERINFASLEISAVASEIDCEEERVDQLASYLKDLEDKTESRLTVTAIVIGAAGAVSAGVLLLSANTGNAPDILGLSTGVAEATLGLLALTNKHSVKLYHTRNFLKDMWEGKAISDLFPSSVWYYLNYADPKTSKTSLRDQVLDRWTNFRQTDARRENKGNRTTDIYFGDGGRYTSEQLKNRANMYDQLESVIKLMKQDLKGLAVEIEKVK